MNKEFWQFINSFAPWLSAIGTFLAVLVALYFSRKDNRINLKVAAYLGEPVFLERPSKKQEFICISVTNVGHRPAILNAIYFENLLKKKIKYFLVSDQSFSSKIPIKLNDGEQADYYFPLEDFIKGNIDMFKKLILSGVPIFSSRFICVSAKTTTQARFKNRINKYLSKVIIKTLNKYS